MKPTANTPLGVIGAGNMGMGMVQRWRDGGGAVHVCDIDPARQRQASGLGCQVHSTPASLAQALPADGLLVICVVDAAQSRDVLFGQQGAANAMQAGQTVMLCPTIAPEDTEGLAAELQTRGIACIDAPMSGGPLRAAQGTMSLMVACDDASWALHHTALQHLAEPVFRVGQRIGDGARTKLVNNLLAGINLVGAAEVLALAERLGLNTATTLDVIERSSGQSWIGSDRMRRALAEDWAPRAHMTLLAKDTRLAVAAARAADFDGPLGASAAAAFQEALGDWAECDDAAMLAHLRKRAPGGDLG